MGGHCPGGQTPDHLLSYNGPEIVSKKECPSSSIGQSKELVRWSKWIGTFLPRFGEKRFTLPVSKRQQQASRTTARCLPFAVILLPRSFQLRKNSHIRSHGIKMKTSDVRYMNYSRLRQDVYLLSTLPLIKRHQKQRLVHQIVDKMPGYLHFHVTELWTVNKLLRMERNGIRKKLRFPSVVGLHDMRGV